jgi:hypothetical protein
MTQPPNSRSQLRLTRLLTAVILGLGMTLSSLTVASEIGAAVVVVNHVTGAVAPQKTPMELRAGIDVFQDEVVRSSDNSAARVVFQDKTTLEVAPASEVTLDQFVFDPDPALSKVAVSVVSGVARFTTGTLPKDDYKIYTPAGSLSVRGTVLDIHVDAMGGAFIFVEDGIVIFTAGGHSVTINAGQSSFARAGGTPSAPTNTPFPSNLMNQMFALLLQTSVTGATPGPVSPTPLGSNPPTAITDECVDTNSPSRPCPR